MKKRGVFLAMFLLMSFAGLSQSNLTWLSLAVKGGYGTGYLYNSDAFFNDDYVLWSYFTPAYSLGGKLGFAFGDGNFSVSVEGLKSSFGQEYQVATTTQTTDYKAQVDLLQLGLIFKAYSNTGFYVEFGPQYNAVKKAVLNQDDITTDLSDNFTSAAFGFGFMPVIGQQLEISLGLRAVTSLASILANDNFNFYQYSPGFSNYQSANISGIMIMPVFEINYIFAYMGRASCGAFGFRWNTGNTTRRVKIRY